MTRFEREQLIECYLSGQMDSVQEENFFIEVASNRELRQELKAYRVVEQAMANEGAKTTSTYTALRSSVQGMLIASGAQASAGTESASAANNTGVSVTGGAGVSGVAGTIVPIKWLIGVVLVASVGVGTVLLDPLGFDNDRNVPAEVVESSNSPASTPPQLPEPGIQAISREKDDAAMPEQNDSREMGGVVQEHSPLSRKADAQQNNQNVLGDGTVRTKENEGAKAAPTVDSTSKDSVSPLFQIKVHPPKEKE